MRILKVNSLYFPYVRGGAEVVVKTLSEGLVAAGHDVVVASTCEPEKYERDVELIEGVQSIRYPIKNRYWIYAPDKKGLPDRLLWHSADAFNKDAANDLRSLVEEVRPDIVVCHNISGWSSSIWPALASINVPVVQVLHDYYNLCVKTSLFNGEKRCVGRCLPCRYFRRRQEEMSKDVNGVIAVSQAVLDRHFDAGLFSCAQTKAVIYNSISQAPIPESHQRGFWDVRRFGFIGRLAPEKGVEVMVDAFKEIEARFPEACLWIAGDGDPTYVESLISRSQSENIRFLGRVKAETFYQDIDVLIVPSIWDEPFGLVVAEAAAYGVPVVAHPVGGIPEIISSGVGILASEPTVAALADALMRCMTEPETLISVRTQLPAVAERFANTEAMVMQHEEFYREILNGHR
ncbi:glycosyltransferase family 4 protein [Nitrogeniibacter aestuarii]|uniref:glycosyltransferase family 4 protein n=1 Tax=Nitrogeniibacter aestuarii TaxID=2815343 RepID=UPI001E594F35|nr:glycosyltransferase family 4 protein [Nitrogeniibacter aestuarii]